MNRSPFTVRTKGEIDMKKTVALSLFGLVTLSLLANGAFAQSKAREEIAQSREQILSEILAKRAELQELESRFLAPLAEDRTAFADFLRQPNTGLIRLLPRESYDSDTYNNKKTLSFRGGGAYYSFTRLTHEYGFGTQLGLERDQLQSSFAGADYGMLANLGDIPLEDVSLDSLGAQFPAAQVAVSEEPKARIEQRRFAEGTTVEGITYKRSLPALVSSTYLERSISFGEADVLVAFRVVRKDTDGSLIIAWKLLKTYPKPELARSVPTD
jgi:hypothetical protein